MSPIPPIHVPLPALHKLVLVLIFRRLFAYPVIAETVKDVGVRHVIELAISRERGLCAGGDDSPVWEVDIAGCDAAGGDKWGSVETLGFLFSMIIGDHTLRNGCVTFIKLSIFCSLESVTFDTSCPSPSTSRISCRSGSAYSGRAARSIHGRLAGVKFPTETFAYHISLAWTPY